MVVRIAGVTIPEEKRIEVALTYIFGVGLSSSKKILEKAKIKPDTRAKNLGEGEINKIRKIIEEAYKVEGDLKQDITSNIRRLKEISAYRGIRHTLKLPVKGQRTRTNARTKRGKKVTIGSGRKKTAAKT